MKVLLGVGEGRAVSLSTNYNTECVLNSLLSIHKPKCGESEESVTRVMEHFSKRNH